MKKFIKISLVAAVAIVLLAQIGYSIGSSIAQDQFSKEMNQFNNGIISISLQAEHLRKKNCLLKKRMN